MAIRRRQRSVAYGLTNALQDLAPESVVTQRDPSTADKAQEGTAWINTATNDVFMLSSFAGGQAQWLNLAGGAGVFDSITATTGDITANVGNFVATAGNISAPMGDITAATGTVSGAAGDFTTLDVGAGGLDVTGTLTLGAETDGVLLTDGVGLITATQGTDGEVLIGSTGAAPAFASITSTGATITITPGANSLNLERGGDAGVSDFQADAGAGAQPAAGVITFAGGTGINTSAAGSTVTFNLDDPLSVAGSITAGTSLEATTTVTAGTGLTVTTGDIKVTAGTVNIPTTAAGEGQIQLNSQIYLHGFGTRNTFAGQNAGNLTLTGSDLTGIGPDALRQVTTATQTMAIGSQAATSLQTGTQNTVAGADALENATAASNTTAIGYQALNAATSSTDNTALGSGALSALLTGTGNLAAGKDAGSNYTGAESDNILVGHPGVVGESSVCRIGNGSTAKFFVGGVDGVTTDSGTTATVLISDEGQMGTVSSSRRYKENIEDMGSYDDAIMRFRPVSFEYKQRPGRREVGLIAEEVQEIMPSLVNLNAEGQAESVQYHNLPPLMLNQLKKMYARVQKLEEKASACTCRN